MQRWVKFHWVKFNRCDMKGSNETKWFIDPFQS